jgi:endonuclease-8
VAEGDSILRLARRIDERLGGKTVTVRSPGPRRPAGLPPSAIDGRVLERAESRGKHLLIHFEGGVALHSHLGMRGSWQLYAEGERWRRPASQAWIALTAEGIEAVNFGGSTMRIARQGQLRRDPRLARLGPDILGEGFEVGGAVRSLRRAGPGTELGEALLDQSLVAGIGNIFKSEGCFESRLDPRAPLESLGDEQLGSVLEATRGLMLESVDSGRPPSRVYRRARRPCPRCGTAIRSAAQGDSARVSYWCPGCQRQPDRQPAGPADRAP